MYSTCKAAHHGPPWQPLGCLEGLTRPHRDANTFRGTPLRAPLVAYQGEIFGVKGPGGLTKAP